MDISSFLRENASLKEVSDDDLEFFATNAGVRTFKENETVIKQGTTGNNLWIIYNGEVEVSRTGEDSEKQCLTALGPGDIFGEISVLSGEHTIAQVTTTKPSTIIRIPAEVLSRVIEGNERFKGRLTSLFVDRLADTIRRTRTE